MLYVRIHTELHHTDRFYVYKDDEENEKVYIDGNDKSNDYIYDLETGLFDVYNIAVWGNGAFSQNVENKEHYFHVKTKSKLFGLTELIDKREHDSEVFDDWCAARRDQDYYLYVRVYSIKEEPISQLLKLVSDWCEGAGDTVSNEPFDWPSRDGYFNEDGENEIDEKGKELYLDTDDIRLLEELDLLENVRNLSWDISLPEYEGSGTEAFLLLKNVTEFVGNLLGHIESMAKAQVKKDIRHAIIDKGIIAPHNTFRMQSSNEDEWDACGYTVYWVDEYNENREVVKCYKVTLLSHVKDEGEKLKIEEINPEG